MRRRGASAFGAPLLIFFSPYLNRSIEILSQPLNRDDEWNRNRETGSDIWGVVFLECGYPHGVTGERLRK